MISQFGRRLRKSWRVHPGTDCWEWIASTNQKGYGYCHRVVDGVTHKLAHRWSYHFHRGAIPDGMLVLHRCDNPCCVNPEHLFVGTPQENSADCIEKGRHTHHTPSPGSQAGERGPLARLTWEQADAIRAATGSYRSIAAHFGVSHVAVSNIKNGHTWKEEFRPGSI